MSLMVHLKMPDGTAKLELKTRTWSTCDGASRATIGDSRAVYARTSGKPQVRSRRRARRLTRVQVGAVARSRVGPIHRSRQRPGQVVVIFADANDQATIWVEIGERESCEMDSRVRAEISLVETTRDVRTETVRVHLRSQVKAVPDLVPGRVEDRRVALRGSLLNAVSNGGAVRNRGVEDSRSGCGGRVEHGPACRPPLNDAEGQIRTSAPLETTPAHQ